MIHIQLPAQVVPAGSFVSHLQFNVKYSRQVPLGCAYSMQHITRLTWLSLFLYSVSDFLE